MSRGMEAPTEYSQISTMLDHLTTVYAVWCARNDVPHIDAAELLARAYSDDEAMLFNDAQREWLGAFVKVWDGIEHDHDSPGRTIPADPPDLLAPLAEALANLKQSMAEAAGRYPDTTSPPWRDCRSPLEK